MSVDAALGHIAARQFGVMAHEQCEAAGLSRHAIAHRLATGRWTRPTRGVYVLAGAPASFEQRVMVACVASNGAVASHRTGGTIHRLGKLPASADVHVAVPPDHSGRSSVAVVHRSRDLAPRWVTTVGGLPVTTIERTMLDVAATVFRRRFAEVLDDALDRRLTTWDAMSICLSAHARRGRPGVATLRHALEMRGDGLEVTQSVLERHYLEFCARRGLPLPITQFPLRWRYRVVGTLDMAYPFGASHRRA